MTMPMALIVAMAMIAVFRLARWAVARLFVVGSVEAGALVDDGNRMEPAPGISFAAGAGPFGGCAKALP